jgi:hypothetical protein
VTDVRYFRNALGCIASNETEGATDISECPYRDRRGGCKCGTCAVCGFGPHVSLHLPSYGQPPGSKPWAHKFIPLGDEPLVIDVLPYEESGNG